MNHSGNERLSFGSPRAEVLTQDFASNIWYTLCFSSGQGWWNTPAHVIECFSEADTEGKKKVFALHVRKWAETITQCNASMVQRFARLAAEVWFSPSAFKIWRVCFKTKCCSIKRRTCITSRCLWEWKVDWDNIEDEDGLIRCTVLCASSCFSAKTQLRGAPEPLLLF